MVTIINQAACVNPWGVGADLVGVTLRHIGQANVDHVKLPNVTGLRIDNAAS
jgi:hypothetical protein